MKKIKEIKVKRQLFRHGQWFKATIDGVDCVGKVSINDSGKVFFCQNHSELNGSDASNKLGFYHSWVLDDNVKKLKLLSRKPASFKTPVALPKIGTYSVILVDGGETVKVGCTPVSRELYLEVGRKAGWIE